MVSCTDLPYNFLAGDIVSLCARDGTYALIL